MNFVVVLEPSRQQSDYGLSIWQDRQPSIIAFEGFDECLRDAVGLWRADWRETKLEAQGSCGVERVLGDVRRAGQPFDGMRRLTHLGGLIVGGRIEHRFMGARPTWLVLLAAPVCGLPAFFGASAPSSDGFRLKSADFYTGSLVWHSFPASKITPYLAVNRFVPVFHRKGAVLDTHEPPHRARPWNFQLDEVKDGGWRRLNAVTWSAKCHMNMRPLRAAVL